MPGAQRLQRFGTPRRITQARNENYPHTRSGDYPHSLRTRSRDLFRWQFWRLAS